MTRLLRYICASALTEDGEQITEYTIALDVLGKTEDFKEGKDAIVRVEVHRLRKRLAEFYTEEGASHRVRIVIPTGKYVPQFQIRDDSILPKTNGPDRDIIPPESTPIQVPPNPLPATPAAGVSAPRRRPTRLWAACAGLFLVAILPAYQVFRTEDQPFDTFWNPVLSSANPILLCIGNLSGGHTHPVTEGGGTGPLTLKEFHSAESQIVHVADAATLARFASLIHSKGKRYRIVSQSEATYSELQRSPVILIGLLNNDWTKRLVGKLRFTVERPGNGKVFIRDRSDASRNDWFIDYYGPYMDVSRDYALVLRAMDPKTEQMVVTAAGLSIFGTIAAGEFLTNQNEIRKLAAAAPKGWGQKNFEIVLATEVIRGNPGPPSVVAAHFW